MVDSAAVGERRGGPRDRRVAMLLDPLVPVPEQRRLDAPAAKKIVNLEDSKSST